ncbi:MAG: repeat-containing protein YrrB [Verrucomicrobiota bacterium]
MAARSRSTVVPAAGVSRDWRVTVCGLLLVAAVVLAYANSLSAPFVFDDMRGIVENQSIRSLWPLTDALFAPGNATGAVGRPVVNLSLAINYALGGLDVRGYHAFNLAFHALAALTLFGLMRRTLRLPTLAETWSRQSVWLAAGVTGLWALHPLQTESVTCVIQRTELLGSLFYLLTLYGFVRAVDAPNVARWLGLSVAASAVGMAAKEIVATVPVIVLLYDRAFVAGSFAAAWHARRAYYLGLAVSWLGLVALMLVNHDRGGIVGFGLGMSAWDYALTQCQALVMYAKLACWPHPLVLDYGAEVVSGLGAVWWQGILVLTAVGATLWALVRAPRTGTVAFAAFAVLAPSSSFIPLTTQTMAEHRMYLPLAGVIILVAVAAARRWPRGTPATLAGVALLAGVGTATRNEDYRSVLAIWSDSVAKWPDNPRAQLSLGSALAEAGRLREAVAHYETALAQKPGYADAAYNLGNAWLKLEDFPAAVAAYQRAVALKPDYAEAHYALGYCLIRTGRLEEGLTHYARSEEIFPDSPVTLRSHASALIFARRFDEAKQRYEHLLRLTPADVGVRTEYGSLLAHLGEAEAAQRELETALRSDPRNPVAGFALGLVMVRQGKLGEAAAQFTQLLRMHPGMAEARNALGKVLLDLGRWEEAVSQFREAVWLKPGWAEARNNLESAELRRDLRSR